MRQRASDPHVHTSSWLRVLREAASGQRTIVCFPHAGGGVLSVAKLARSIPERFGLTVVALPGREPGDQTSPPRRAAAAGRKLADDIAAFSQHSAGRVRLVFLGNSYGALLAFETALSLRPISDAIDSSPAIRLIVSGFRSPSLPPADAPIFGLPTEDLLAELAQRFGLSSGDLARSGLFNLESALRADLEACDTYRHRSGSTLDTRIDILHMTQDVSVSPAELRAWQDVTTRPIVTTKLDCGHFPWATDPDALAGAVVSLIDAPAS